MDRQRDEMVLAFQKCKLCFERISKRDTRVTCGFYSKNTVLTQPECLPSVLCFRPKINLAEDKSLTTLVNPFTSPRCQRSDFCVDLEDVY